MKHRSRLRRIAMWGGVVVCLLIVAAFLWSGWYGCSWGEPAGYVAIRNGTLHFEHHDYPLPFPLGRRGWTTAREIWPSRFTWLPDIFIIDDMIRMNGRLLRRSVKSVTIPFWMPFLLTAGLTAFSWRRSARTRKPGHCPCGYNLTGNVSGPCPECGLPFEPRGDTP